MEKLKRVLALLFISVLLVACGNGNEGSTDTEGQSTDSEQTTEANADWPEKMVFVQYTNDENESSPAMQDAFREHLSNELGIEVEEFTGQGSYAPSIEGMAAGEIDVMLVSPQSFIQAKDKADAELFATTSNDRDYYTAFITQADNDEINSLEDLKGKNFAFVDPSSSSGYLYPKATLISELGLDSGQLEQSGYFFENVIFAGDHENAAIGVEMGDYDAAAVASTQLPRFIEAGIVNEENIKEFARSVDIPNSGYAIRGDLPEDFKKAVQDAFVSFNDSEYFDVIYGDPETKFTAVDESYYEDAIEAYELVGMEEGE